MAGKNHKQFLYGINTRLKVSTVFNISRYQVCDDSMFIRDMINTTFEYEVIKCPATMFTLFRSIMSAGIQVESFRLQETIYDV